MNKESGADRAAEAMAAALDQTAAQNPHLNELLQAFRAIMVEQARWKEEMPTAENGGGPAPDSTRLGKGIPLSDREQLARLGGQWSAAVERLIPPLAAGFPKIGPELDRLRVSVIEERFAPDFFLSATLAGREDEARQSAEEIGLQAEILAFALLQAAKPVVERRAEGFQIMLKGSPWDKGLCPVCGSSPELSLLKEKEGQRWLRCGFCSSVWRFHRTSCPSCNAQEAGSLEIIFVEGREHERVEVCNRCKTYIPGLDLRSLVDEVVLDVARFVLMPLEAVAQGKGFVPMSKLRWNLF